jgi:hypothetical protein
MEQEMPQQFMYRHCWMSFRTCHWHLTVSLMKLVYGEKQLVLGRLCSSIGLSGFANHQTSDYRNFAVCVYVCVCVGVHACVCFVCVCVCVYLFLKQNDIKQCDNYKYEICALLWFYAVLIGSFLGMFWDNQLVPASGVKQLTLEVGTGRRTAVIVTVGEMTQVPYWGCTGVLYSSMWELLSWHFLLGTCEIICVFVREGKKVQ